MQVSAGQQITEGSKNPHRILRIQGQEAAQHYLLNELQKVYRNQGVNIADKHFEIIIRKMMSKVQITRSGDSELLPGELVDKLDLLAMNERLIAEGKEPASAVPVLLGVTKAALSTESFLSASSFQHTIKVLAGAAIEGKVDKLYGLKENVIIGKLIPAGTGFQAYQERQMAVNKDELEPKFVLSGAGSDDEDEEDDELLDEERVPELGELEEDETAEDYDEEEVEEEEEELVDEEEEDETFPVVDDEEEMSSLEMVAEDEEELDDFDED
jgi:DNA-directed RNA polymerase subunit beta'